MSASVRTNLVVLAVAAVLAACATTPPQALPPTIPPPELPTTVLTTTSTTTTTTTTTLPPTTSTTLPPTTTTTTFPPPNTPNDAPAGPPAPINEPTVPRQVTVADPLKVWVIGDSLAGPLGYALSAQVRDSGLARVQVDHVGGSGLTNPQYLDWPRTISDTMPGVRPDGVVIHIGANDARSMFTPEGWSAVGTEAWGARYAALAGGVMDQLLRGADRVFWVGAPVMGSERFSADVRFINSVFRSEAAMRAGVIYIDSYGVFTGESGGFSRYVSGADGVSIEARAGDGVHYTSAGAALLADVVRPLVLFEWRIWPSRGG